VSGHRQQKERWLVERPGNYIRFFFFFFFFFFIFDISWIDLIVHTLPYHSFSRACTVCLIYSTFYPFYLLSIPFRVIMLCYVTLWYSSWALSRPICAVG
jgi:hypothetical protein